MAGHSKWANIKHRKAAVDARRGQRFTKLSKEIIVAARLGGGDPESNARLRMAIQNARAVSMPNDNIRRAIQRGTGDVDGAVYEERMYEGYGPGGVAIVIATTSDNRNRTVADIRAAFNKCDGNMGEANSVLWNFEHRGELVVETSMTEDDLLMIALDCGADDVAMVDGGAIIQCPVDSLGQCNNQLSAAGLSVQQARFVYHPKTRIAVTDRDTAKKLIKLLDLLEDSDDVQSVDNNADIDDAIVDALS